MWVGAWEGGREGGHLAVAVGDCGRLWATVCVCMGETRTSNQTNYPTTQQQQQQRSLTTTFTTIPFTTDQRTKPSKFDVFVPSFLPSFLPSFVRCDHNQSTGHGHGPSTHRCVGVLVTWWLGGMVCCLSLGSWCCLGGFVDLCWWVRIISMMCHPRRRTWTPTETGIQKLLCDG